MLSLSSSITVVLLSSLVLLSSFSSNTAPLANGLSIPRARGPVFNNQVMEPRAITVEDLLDSNENHRREEISVPALEKSTAALIPRALTGLPLGVKGGQNTRPNSRPPPKEEEDELDPPLKVDDQHKTQKDSEHRGKHVDKKKRPETSGNDSDCDEKDEKNKESRCPPENETPPA